MMPHESSEQAENERDLDLDLDVICLVAASRSCESEPLHSIYLPSLDWATIPYTIDKCYTVILRDQVSVRDIDGFRVVV